MKGSQTNAMSHDCGHALGYRIQSYCGDGHNCLGFEKGNLHLLSY